MICKLIIESKTNIRINFIVRACALRKDYDNIIIIIPTRSTLKKTEMKKE